MTLSERALGPRWSLQPPAPLCLLALAAAAPLGAQVGHDPARSPYRDLRYNQFVAATAGYLFGTGGQLGIGPHGGWVVTLRHEFLADRALSIALLGGHGRLQRSFADLQATRDPRVKGPVEHGVSFAEGLLQLNATGGKTWHNLAPYVAAGLGLAFSQRIDSDSSGYRFGTKFYFAPALGVRAFISRRLYLRLEARTLFWNLGYPQTYRTIDPDGFGPLEPILARRQLKEWSPVPMLHAGLGFAFHRPFF
jgi:hypothetical protein